MWKLAKWAIFLSSVSTQPRNEGIREWLVVDPQKMGTITSPYSNLVELTLPTPSLVSPIHLINLPFSFLTFSAFVRLGLECGKVESLPRPDCKLITTLQISAPENRGDRNSASVLIRISQIPLPEPLVFEFHKPGTPKLFQNVFHYLNHPYFP